MVKKILYTVFIVLVLWVSWMAYENYLNKKYLRAAADRSWLRQMNVAIHSYNEKYGIWPEELKQINGIDHIDERAFVSRQGRSLGIQSPHYIYLRPSSRAVSEEIILYLNPECMEMKRGSTMVSYFDGRVATVPLTDIPRK